MSLAEQCLANFNAGVGRRAVISFALAVDKDVVKEDVDDGLLTAYHFADGSVLCTKGRAHYHQIWVQASK